MAKRSRERADEDQRENGHITADRRSLNRTKLDREGDCGSCF